MEELFIISGNFLVQVTYGVYMVFLNGVFNAGVNPLFLVVFGNSVTAVVLLPFALAFEKKKWPTRLSATLLSHFLLLSLGGVTLFQALMLVGIKKASPDVASAMPNLTPGLIFIISACLRFEKFDACCWYSRAKIMGTLVCLAGVLTMCFLQGTSETPRLANNWSFLLAKPLTLDKAINKDWVLGCFYLLAGVFILSCTTVLQAATMLKFPAPLSLVVITSVMGSSLTALLQLITEGKISVGPTTMSITSIVAIVLLGGVVMGTCMAFQGWCITKKGPVLVSIFCPIQTVSTVVVSAALLGQIISLGSLAGIVLMFAGLYIVLWAKKNETFSMLDVDAEPEVLVEDVEKPLLS
ncbi:WAT1-related protein At5g47470-like isoform X1 [Musa acuminata AAA Group]|uniref:WAT1-related protein At5g47470-like isoform X1 n=2 Tax=Musa acuminata AAA Group TaxID=214697 RepID=UPI0031D93F1D